ncbi:GNAT family N-acetyltransferase [Adhaeribacter soli]|uniref:N-acetyltransferase n=1 Tax=Adhaeribacter soli TaxID=2607655 RepID=A0A5N1J0Y2_9BACT|nr:GNAT family N-acetyltransferase [Adhaeribacter soli]KAA9340151.1 N-acetyltransferase [Adhaeribacter soli]
MKTKIEHDKKYQQFTLNLGDDEAELAYSKPDEKTIAFTHTYVPEAARGNGMADRLIEAGLRYAEAHNLRVVPGCEVVEVFFQRHPEFGRLLK